MLPIAGGNYMRQLPHRLHARLFAEWDRRYSAPFNLYFNVWELDQDLPRISAASWLAKLRQYRNVSGVQERLRDYFTRYRFQSIAEHLGIEPPRSETATPASSVEANDSALGMAGDEVTVVVPCYNEEKTIPYLLNTLREVQAELLPRWRLRFVFVDDASQDGTLAALENLIRGRADCELLRHETNRGVAAGIMTGIRHARTSAVASIDCDCTYDPSQLAALLPLLAGDVAMVTASPYHRDGIVRGVPRWRLFLSRGLSLLYRALTSQPLATYTSCFRIYRRELVKDISLTNEGFLGVAEMLVRLDQRGARILEHPAKLEVRLFGESKMKTVTTIFDHLRLLWQLARARDSAKPARAESL
jgi:hypothetical protein